METPLYLQAIGVIIAIGSISLFVWFVNYQIKGLSEQTGLLRTIILIFVAIVGVYICNKMVFIHVALLSDSENNTILSFIQDTLKMLVGFFIGSQVNNKNKEL